MSEMEREKVEGEIERLRGLRKDLDRDWSHLKYYAIPMVLAGPAFFLWGAIASSLVVLGTASVLATAAYLIGVRRKEYEGEIELWQEQLGRLEE
ncbi:MAG: hypothetical protein CMN31_10115 [Sandaracinus sp.]|nr:hypothetical protein [Myxococcales bacterium]MAT25721.1 hypothetical protein [Sandaracinus sp.]MBJ71678.1 hypothetical protein [Sandaracinus sp.]